MATQEELSNEATAVILEAALNGITRVMERHERIEHQGQICPAFRIKMLALYALETGLNPAAFEVSSMISVLQHEMNELAESRILFAGLRTTDITGELLH